MILYIQIKRLKKQEGVILWVHIMLIRLQMMKTGLIIQLLIFELKRN